MREERRIPVRNDWATIAPAYRAGYELPGPIVQMSNSMRDLFGWLLFAFPGDIYDAITAERDGEE